MLSFRSSRSSSAKASKASRSLVLAGFSRMPVMRSMWVRAILAMSFAQSSQWWRLPHLLHQLGVDGPLDLADLELQLVLGRASAGRFGSCRRWCNRPCPRPCPLVLPLAFSCFLLDLVGDGDDFHLAGVFADQVQLVDHRVEAVIVRAQGLQHLPHHRVGLVVVQRLVRLHAGRDHHRQDRHSRASCPVHCA